MVQSLAALHRQSVEGVALPVVLPVDGLSAQGRLMLVQLSVDRSKLQALRSKRRKALLKRELILHYSDYLSVVINTPVYQHNEVLVTVCLWALDAGNYSYFIKLAEGALQGRMSAPQGFKRKLPEVLAEELAEQVLQSAQPSQLSGYLRQLQTWLQGEDMADEITAKFYKALGLSLQHTEPAQALAALQTARQYGASVVRLIRALEKEVNHGV